MFHIPALVCAYLEPRNDLCPAILSQDERDVLWIRCQDEGNEFHELFTEVYTRLHYVHQELQGCGRGNLRRSVVVVLLLRRLVGRFQAVVTRHREQHLLVRFATKRPALNRVKELHKVVDALFGYLQLESHPLMTQWSQRWPQQCDRMYELFQAEVKLPRQLISRLIVRLTNAEIAEILGLLKFEVNYHLQVDIDQVKKLQGDTTKLEEQAKLMSDTIKNILRCSSVHVPSISEFYMPSVEIYVGDDHSKVRGTKCKVKRGVYDQETRLVAQYLSADDRYARQLFWRATAMWHNFHHQNVAKMLGESIVELQPWVVWENVAAHGNFIHYFATEHEDNQRRLWRMFLQVGHGLSYIHQQGKTHGSLKCSHILVAEDGTPKICHFELSKGSDLGAFDRWKAPEYNLGQGFDPSKAGDVYSFGLCIIEARTGNIPYGVDCDEGIRSQLEAGECYPRPEGMCADEWDVVRRFVARKPENRPTMAEAIEMMERLARKEATEEETGAASVKTP